ncbi:MAG: CHAT domain-containing protein [Saprospiraceae bacterium]|nr:CHAT domain-containing protein [Saprospiraceae bacterium]
MKLTPPARLLLLLGFFVLPFVFAQKNEGQDAFFEQIEQWFKEEKDKQAKALLYPALQQSRQAKDWKKFTLSTHWISKILNKEKKYDSCIAFLEENLRLLKTTAYPPIEHTGSMYSLLALNQARLDNFVEALANYDAAIQIFDNLNIIGEKPAYCYKNAAQAFVRREDYSRAIQYFEAGLRIDTAGKYRAVAHAQLANCYHYMGDEKKTMQYYQLAIEEGTEDPAKKAEWLVIGHTAFVAKGQPEVAIRMLQEAFPQFPKETKYASDRVRCLTALATLAEQQGKFAEASRYFNLANTICKKFYPNKNREVAIARIAAGDFQLRRNNPDAAIQAYQQAMIQVFPGFNNPDIQTNPSFADVRLESQAMFAAASKARAILKKNKLSTQDRNNAAECFDLSLAVSAGLRQTFSSDADKFMLMKEIQENYRLAVLNLWHLARETHAPGGLEKLMEVLEKHKAQALSDALHRQSALALSSIPDSLLKREEYLNQIKVAAQMALELPNPESDSATIAYQKSLLFQTTRQYDELLSRLKSQYPKFDEYSQAAQTAPLADIRKALPPSATLLSWFDAGDRYLCLALRPQGLSAYEVRRDSALDQALLRFQHLLADKNAQETQPNAYFNQAYWLKQRLLPDSILAGSPSLILVPDGRLAYLPFEALLSAPHQGSFGSAPYLLRSHTLQYAWSATLLTRSVPTAAPDKGLLHLAPFVQASRSGLAALPNSLHEYAGSAQVLQGSTATADLFLDQAPAYRVLHLSTHAHAGQREQPGIEFFDRSLSLPEIYALRLNASLVTLSACETGAGAFAEGEGVLSLARAFAYAGAQSLVASYWPVADRATASLFSAFYQQLETGTPKAEALRQAKLQLLAASDLDARKAPYYWAAFTLSGADGPVALGGGWPWWVWVLGLGALLLAGIVTRIFNSRTLRRAAA